MSTEENKVIVRRFVEEVVNKRNLASLDELLSPDYTWRNASATRAEPGLEFCWRLLAAEWGAFPDLTWSIEDMTAEGDRVVSRQVMHGTHLGDLPWGPGGSVIKPTGNKATVGSIVISRISGGRIAEEWESIEFDNLWRQLGALPTPG